MHYGCHYTGCLIQVVPLLLRGWLTFFYSHSQSFYSVAKFLLVSRVDIELQCFVSEICVLFERFIMFSTLPNEA